MGDGIPPAVKIILPVWLVLILVMARLASGLDITAAELPPPSHASTLYNQAADSPTEVEVQPAAPVQAAVEEIPDGDCKVSRQFPKKVRQWCELITSYAEKHNLPTDLVAALIWQESGGNAQAFSRSGAVGLMQVMPRDGPAASFQCPNGPCFANRPTIKQLEDPAFNVEYGTRMLARLVQRTGNLRSALKAYGPMDVGFSYADRVLSLYEKYGN